MQLENITDITRYVFVQYFFMTHDLSHNSLCKQELKVLNNCQEAASSSIWIFSILLRLSNWHSTEKKGGIRSKQIHLWHLFKQNKLKFSSQVKSLRNMCIFFFRNIRSQFLRISYKSTIEIGNNGNIGF